MMTTIYPDAQPCGVLSADSPLSIICVSAYHSRPKQKTPLHLVFAVGSTVRSQQTSKWI